MTVREAAKHWGCSVENVHRLIRAGRLKVEKIESPVSGIGFYYKILDRDKPPDRPGGKPRKNGTVNKPESPADAS